MPVAEGMNEIGMTPARPDSLGRRLSPEARAALRDQMAGSDIVVIAARRLGDAKRSETTRRESSNRSASTSIALG